MNKKTSIILYTILFTLLSVNVFLSIYGKTWLYLILNIVWILSAAIFAYGNKHTRELVEEKNELISNLRRANIVLAQIIASCGIEVKYEKKEDDNNDKEQKNNNSNNEHDARKTE